MAMALNDEAYIERTETFSFGGISRQTKVLSLRPRRLCGENSILDKHGQKYYFVIF
jgi:hypothetical protein